MAHLYPHLRIHQVFGANTDVGKTIFSTALCLASAALPLDASAAPPSNVLAAASQRLGEQVHYLKPVSTGNLSDSDDAHISRYAPGTQYKTLYRFGEAVSPHLAVELERRAQPTASSPPTDEQFIRETGNWIHAAAAASATAASGADSLSTAVAQSRAVAYVETAGGVHSPGPSGLSQSQLLRPLRLPTILIGSAELGGISTTRSAFESLMMNGYDVEAVLLFPSPRYGNVEYLRKFFQLEHGIPVFGLAGPNNPSAGLAWGGPPVRNVDTKADQLAMQQFYQGLVLGRTKAEISDARAEASKEEDAGGVYSVVRLLREKHQQRMHELSTLAGRTRETCWWPFTQHTLTSSNKEVNVIDSAYGDFFVTMDQRDTPRADGKPSSLLQPVLDGSASWWTQCLGHAPNRLVQAAARAGARYGHVLFPNGAYGPPLYLSEALIGKTGTDQPEWGPAPLEKQHDHPGAGWASRVFFSDDGSTGMEAAIKMAIQSSICRYAVDRPSSPAAEERTQRGRNPGYMSGRPKREWEILGLKGSYHGDTIGAMDACEPSVYSKAVDWYRGRGYWFEPPSVEWRADGVTIRVAGDGQGVFKAANMPESIRSREGSGNVFEASYASMNEAYDVEKRLQTDPLAKIYRSSVRAELERLVLEEGRRFGAVILEPLVMGAGGMIFVDPLFQRVLIDVVRESEDLFSLSDPPSRSARSPSFNTSRPASGRDASEWQGLPVIFDEVFTGLYRLGHATPSCVLGTTPDVSCLAKILTGGMVPMSVTLASTSIFRTFSSSQDKVDALLHGHSYTAHPIGCEVAIETLRAIGELKRGADWDAAKEAWGVGEAARGVWSFWEPKVVERLSSLPGVDHAVAMGTVLKVALATGEGEGGYTSTASVELLKKLRYQPSALQGHPSVPVTHSSETGEAPFNVHARPLGNVVYFMSSLNTPRSVLRATETLVYDAISG